MNTSGFYKNEDGKVLYGEHFVYNKDYVLNVDTKDDHTYPVDGWYYFDSMESAYLFWNLELPDQGINNG
jgi:hypothetical protein